MKRTIKVLSIGLVAFMLAGCNVFKKFSDEVTFQEYSFNAKDQISDAEKEELLFKADRALQHFSEIKVTVSLNSYLPNFEISIDSVNTIKAYNNNYATMETKGEASMKTDGVTRTEKGNEKKEWYTVSYLVDEEPHETTLVYAESESDGVKLSQSTSDAYTLAGEAGGVTIPGGYDIYKTKSGFITVTSSIEETRSLEPYEDDVKEYVSVTKNQNVWTFNKQYQLVKMTGYTETSANRDASGKWYKSLTTISKNTYCREVKYAERKEGKTSNIFDAFDNAYFGSSVYMDLYKYSVEEGSFSTTTGTHSFLANVTKYVASNKIHAEAVIDFDLTSTFNGFAIEATASYFDNYKDSSSDSKSEYVFTTEAEGLDALITSDNGTIYYVNGLAENKTISVHVEYDIALSPLGVLSVENAKISVIG